MSIPPPIDIPPSERPLASLVLFTYRQSSFIKAAVEGALAQTYSPLEIIISDDASPDDTFSIIEEVVANYRGPHQVILNRNPVNLGIGAHVDKVISLAKGQWIVTAAGDDICLPDRVAIQMKAAEQHPEAFAIGGQHILIDGEGKPLSGCYAPVRPGFYHRRWVLQQEGRICSGCVMAYRRECWDMFPPIAKELFAEDIILSIRAGLLGGLYVVADEIVHYRMHDHNAGLMVPPESFQRTNDPYTRQFECDIAALVEEGILTKAEMRGYVADLQRYRRYHYYRTLSNKAGLEGFINLIRCNLQLSPWKDRHTISSKLKSILPQILARLRGR